MRVGGQLAAGRAGVSVSTERQHRLRVHEVIYQSSGVPHSTPRQPPRLDKLVPKHQRLEAA